MTLPDTNDTICALSTPPGTGAIALIRITGKQALEITGTIFHSTNPQFRISEASSHSLNHGFILSDNTMIDEVLVGIYRAPHSYTGEDVAEISCHGSEFIQERILRAALEHGCRLARPGEFTLRAFLNRKFDLSQAEAVADLISATSATSHELALHQLRGGFSRKIRDLRQRLVDFTSLIELELDFSEEDVEFASRPGLQQLLEEMQTDFSALIRSFSMGNVIKHGIPVAIIGKPNVGKSTLLNTLLNEEKAIVSDIPGTTRDAIEDTIVLEGFRFRFIDTAGLRVSEEQVESLGIERTRSKIEEASVILYLFDATLDSYADVADSLAGLQSQIREQGKRLILVGNKTDLLSELPRCFGEFVEHETVFISAKRKENIHLLAGSLLKTIQEYHISDGAIVTNTRHLEALQRTLQSVDSALNGLAAGLTSDLLTIDLRQALYHLGTITGEVTTDEILGNIFGRFCIGK